MIDSIDLGMLVLLKLADKSTASGVRSALLKYGITVRRCDPQPRKALRMVSDYSACEPVVAKAGE